MRRALSVLITAALMVIALSVPANADVPEEFGADWDNPTTAVKPLEKPDSQSCRVDLVNHSFTDDEPVSGTFTPPKDCRGDWSRVILTVEGSVSGTQPARLATLEVGDVPLLSTSTPQPSPEGIDWDTERDVTDYAPLLREEQPLSMRMDTDVNDSHTGVFDVQVSLTFYDSDDAHPAPETANDVMALEDASQSEKGSSGEVTLPRNSQRLLADVYAAAPTSGCEADWYFTAETDSGYRCGSDSGPYREVQVLVDGELAGIAAPQPRVYSDGWSNPYLWANLPAPRGHEIRPITFDLTPYLGMLNDGEAHDVSVRVAGAEDEWSLPTALRVWRDANSEVVEGGLLSTTGQPADHEISTAGGKAKKMTATATRTHSATGWLETSRGTILTTVERTLSMSVEHGYTGDTDNRLAASWSDTETRSTVDDNERISDNQTTNEYTMDGSSEVDDSGVRQSEVSAAAREIMTVTGGDGTTRDYISSDEFEGEASYQTDAPRSSHHATASTEQRFRLSGDQPCYDHTVTARNGSVTKDTYRCGSTTIKPRDD